MPACYTCKTRPAGNDYGGPHSAFCEACQPRDTRPQPRSSQCQCGACGRIFATLTDFDRHQDSGRCLDPAPIGLKLAGGVWGTPEGNANRERLAARMTAMRHAERRAFAQADENAPAHSSGTPRSEAA